GLLDGTLRLPLPSAIGPPTRPLHVATVSALRKVSCGGNPQAPSEQFAVAETDSARTVECWKGFSPDARTKENTNKNHTRFMKQTQDLQQYIDHAVLDRNGDKIGTLECLWSDHTGQPAFLGVKTGWLLGKTHVVPAQRAEVNEVG